MHQVVDQAAPERALGRNRLAGEDNVQRRFDADQTGEPLASAGRRDDAELHLGQSELGFFVVAGHTVGTCQRCLETAAQAGAVDRRNHRFAQVLDAVEECLPVPHEAARLVTRSQRGEFLDIRPGDERVRLA